MCREAEERVRRVEMAAVEAVGIAVMAAMGDMQCIPEGSKGAKRMG